jgi:HEAT repeat protein
MNGMRRTRSIAVLLVVGGLGAWGCNRTHSVPEKEIQIADGGAPVLTSAEIASHRIPPRLPSAAELSPAKAGNPVAQAAYEQPIPQASSPPPADEPPALKPFEDWTEQEAAADALGRIGQPAVPELVAALQNPNAAIRLKGVEVLGRMGPEAAPAVPELIKLLDDPDERIRKATARTLGQIGPAAKEAVPALVRTLLESP